MRFLGALLIVSCLVFARSAKLGGHVIPVHLPVENFTTSETFTVPTWLGAYFVYTPQFSNWTLPPTYAHQPGKLHPGMFLIIRNFGPECIVVYPTYPETINGGQSYYFVPAGTAAQIMSDYVDWLPIASGSVEAPVVECPPAPTTEPPETTPVATTVPTM